MRGFIDHCKIHVKAGDGGNGCVAFRRAKYEPMGGPNGGDGGRGGNIFIEVDPQLHTLLDYKYNRIFKAERGLNGSGSQCAGRDGKDMILKVPCGTIVRNLETNEILYDLVEPHSRILLAKGGNGGFGNEHYKSSTNQAPKFANPGLPGEEFDRLLELKLIADVGIIGLPNAGKSTLLSILTKARPKIASYPFTTLAPNLGVMKYDDKQIVLADIPGLIEGASEGKGLGDDFLRHIERTRFFLHMIDASFTEKEIMHNFKVIKHELKEYNTELAKRPELIVLNKSDIVQDPEHLKKLKKKLSAHGKVYMISAATSDGIQELRHAILKTFFPHQD